MRYRNILLILHSHNPKLFNLNSIRCVGIVIRQHWSCVILVSLVPVTIRIDAHTQIFHRLRLRHRLLIVLVNYIYNIYTIRNAVSTVFVIFIVFFLLTCAYAHHTHTSYGNGMCFILKMNSKISLKPFGRVLECVCVRVWHVSHICIYESVTWCIFTVFSIVQLNWMTSALDCQWGNG